MNLTFMDGTEVEGGPEELAQLLVTYKRLSAPPAKPKIEGARKAWAVDTAAAFYTGLTGLSLKIVEYLVTAEGPVVTGDLAAAVGATRHGMGPILRGLRSRATRLQLRNPVLSVKAGPSSTINLAPDFRAAVRAGRDSSRSR